MKNMHVPIPESVHAVLMAHAKATGASATALAREAIEQLAKDIQRDERRARIAAFAEEYAGSAWDLDPELEAAGLEVLNAEANAEKPLDESA